MSENTGTGLIQGITFRRMDTQQARWIVRVEEGWVVTTHDRKSMSRPFGLQVEAIMYAKNDLYEHGGGDLVLVDEQGSVRQVTPVRERRSTNRQSEAPNGR